MGSGLESYIFHGLPPRLLPQRINGRENTGGADREKCADSRPDPIRLPAHWSRSSAAGSCDTGRGRHYGWPPAPRASACTPSRTARPRDPGTGARVPLAASARPGADHSDSPLQSLLHLLQRIRQGFSTRCPLDDAAPHRQAGGARARGSSRSAAASRCCIPISTTLIARIREHGMIATLITNGYLPDADRIQRLNGAGLDYLQISIDNVEPGRCLEEEPEGAGSEAAAAGRARRVRRQHQLGAGQPMARPEDASPSPRRARELGFTGTVGIIHDDAASCSRSATTAAKSTTRFSTARQKPYSFDHYNQFQENLIAGRPTSGIAARAAATCTSAKTAGALLLAAARPPWHSARRYTRKTSSRVRFSTEKGCAPYCTIGCVHRVAMVDDLRTRPAETLDSWFGASGSGTGMPAPVRLLKRVRSCALRPEPCAMPSDSSWATNPTRGTAPDGADRGNARQGIYPLTRSERGLMRVFISVVVAALVVGAGLYARQQQAFRPGDEKMLLNPSPDDWLMYSRTYDAQRFSPLKQITRQNVGQLREVFKKELGIGSAGKHSDCLPRRHVCAAPGATCRRSMRRPARRSGSTSARPAPAGQNDRDLRGHDLSGGARQLHRGARRAHRRGAMGNQIDRAADVGRDRCRRQGALAAAPAARVGDNCYISAHDAKTGKEAWRFYTRRRHASREANVGRRARARRLASTVGTGRRVRSGAPPIYLGHRQPDAEYAGSRHGGNSDAIPTLSPADLYSNSTVALNPATGKLAWYYQHLPGDDWDLDYTNERTLLRTRGESRSEVRQMDQPGHQARPAARHRRDGRRRRRHLCALDRDTGQFLWATPFPFDTPNS